MNHLSFLHLPVSLIHSNFTKRMTIHITKKSTIFIFKHRKVLILLSVIITFHRETQMSSAMCKKNRWILLCILHEITWKRKYSLCVTFLCPAKKKLFFQLSNALTNQPQQMEAWNFVYVLCVCIFYSVLFGLKTPFSPFTLILSVQTHSVHGIGKCHLLSWSYIFMKVSLNGIRDPACLPCTVTRVKGVRDPVDWGTHWLRSVWSNTSLWPGLLLDNWLGWLNPINWLVMFNPNLLIGRQRPRINQGIKRFCFFKNIFIIAWVYCT